MTSNCPRCGTRMNVFTDVSACPECHYHEPHVITEDSATDDANGLAEAIDHIAGRTAEGFIKGFFEVLQRRIRGDRG